MGKSLLESDENYMRLALQLAKRAEAEGEVPVGAVVVCNAEVLGEGWNRVISDNDPSAHAEIVALRAAALKLTNYRLPECELYVTIEPCTMCLGALIHARIGRVIYGAKEPRAGMLDSNQLLSEADFYNHNLQWQGGVLESECSEVMRQFFRMKRKNS